MAMPHIDDLRLFDSCVTLGRTCLPGVPELTVEPFGAIRDSHLLFACSVRGELSASSHATGGADSHPGCPHHITQRGSNRQVEDAPWRDVFFVDDDRGAYV